MKKESTHVADIQLWDKYISFFYMHKSLLFWAGDWPTGSSHRQSYYSAFFLIFSRTSDLAKNFSTFNHQSFCTTNLYRLHVEFMTLKLSRKLLLHCVTLRLTLLQYLHLPFYLILIHCHALLRRFSLFIFSIVSSNPKYSSFCCLNIALHDSHFNLSTILS